jgi:hypothetical protein
MSDFSDYLEQKLMDYVFNKVSYTSPDTYLALYTTATSDAGGGTEVTGGSYARELVDENGGTSPTWNLATVAGTAYRVDNAADVTFTQATASWGTVTHTSVMDAVTSGNMLAHGALTSSKTVDSGDTFKFGSGDFDIDLD